MNFYAIHTYSGQEKRVKSQIESAIVEEKLEEDFGQVLMPTRDISMIKKGKKVTQTKKLMPSYLVVEMNLNRHTKHLITSTPGVTGFVGGSGIKDPPPLRPNEVNRILGQTDKEQERSITEVPFIVGESIKINEGPFKDFDGTVDEINAEKGKLKVMVSVFGRLTPVELDFLQISPLQ
jgi:transcriptional antiterminator NusG